MKKSIAMAAMLMLFAVSAMAVETGKDTVVYNAKNGTVITFDHKAHQGRNDCKVCHGEGTPAKIAIDKDKAHALCRTCHAKANKEKLSEKVSGKCSECHKK